MWADANAIVRCDISNPIVYFGRDEQLLGQGLELYDKLESLLMKHDAIASGSPLPPELTESISKSEVPVASTPVVNSQFEGEEEDDDFAQLARRLKPTIAPFHFKPGE